MNKTSYHLHYYVVIAWSWSFQTNCLSSNELMLLPMTPVKSTILNRLCLVHELRRIILGLCYKHDLKDRSASISFIITTVSCVIYKLLYKACLSDVCRGRCIRQHIYHYKFSHTMTPLSVWYLTRRFIWHLSQSSIRPSLDLSSMWNHARIRSWNKPVLINKGNVSCSRKQRGPLREFQLTTST